MDLSHKIDEHPNMLLKAHYAEYDAQPLDDFVD
jgi:hypothetical protein